jgi:preprotein translocase subunit SecG
MISLFINILLPVEVTVALLIILIVLMQKPKSEGLGAAFGGGMLDQYIGPQVTNVLAGITRVLGGIFFVVTLALAVLYARLSTSHSAIQEAAIKAAMEATPAPLSTPATLGGTTAAFTGTGAISGSEESIGGASMDLGAPEASPANSPLPAPALGGTPAPLAKPAASTSGSAGH